MYVLEWQTVSALTRGVFWCLFPELRSNKGNKHQNNTCVSAETVHHESKYIENNVCNQVTNCFTRWLFWCLFPELRHNNEGNKHQNNSHECAETVHHKSTYVNLFFTRHNESINHDKNDDLYTSSPCLPCSVFILLMMSQSIADDVTMQHDQTIVTQSGE